MPNTNCGRTMASMRVLPRRFHPVTLTILMVGCGPPTPAAPVAPRARAPVPPTADGRVAIALTITDAVGTPVSGIAVGVRGSYDAEPQMVAQTDAKGRVELEQAEPGVAFITVGDTARELAVYKSSATDDTVVVFVDGPVALSIRHDGDGSTLSSEAVTAWPAARSNARVDAYIDALVEAARVGEADALPALVDRQWSEIDDEPDPRLRALMAIHYATYAAQAVGPGRFSALTQWVPLHDRAWVVQSAYLLELAWILGEAREPLLRDLPRHHDDAGLHAALLSWALLKADERGDRDELLALYHQLERPRYAQTIAWRNARKYDPDRAIGIGLSLPAFSVLPVEDGPPITEATLSGKAWLIHVWATWCTPCVEELDELPVLYDSLAAARSRVEFLAVSIDDDRVLTDRTLERHPIAWPSAWAPDREALMQAWGFSGVPLTLLVDDRGKVVKVWDGATSRRAIGAAIDRLLTPP